MFLKNNLNINFFVRFFFGIFQCITKYCKSSWKCLISLRVNFNNIKNGKFLKKQNDLINLDFFKFKKFYS